MEQPRRDRDAPNLVRPYLPSDVPPGPGTGAPPHRQSDGAAASPGHADDVNTLRPYLLTSGRVRPIDETLEIEAQVVATRRGLASQEQLAFEHRDIVVLCAQPVSVAEIGARLGLHIGVTRVLVGDLAALGYLTVARPRPGLHRDVNTIERVIRGLESIQ